MPCARKTDCLLIDIIKEDNPVKDDYSNAKRTADEELDRNSVIFNTNHTQRLTFFIYLFFKANVIGKSAV